MPRLMSVAHTTPQVRARIKTVTRRAGWTFLKVGDRITLCPKVMGRRRGQPLERLVDVEIVDVRREQLHEITCEDVHREGFPDWSREQFLDFFTDTMGGDVDQLVTRIEWRYLEPVADTVAAAVKAHRFFYADEISLHEGLEQAFALAGLKAEREVSLNPSGRIDFVVNERTGVEVKVAGSATAVARQLARYAPHVDDLVLVTTKARHRDVPIVIGGKPVRTIVLRGAGW